MATKANRGRVQTKRFYLWSRGKVAGVLPTLNRHQETGYSTIWKFIMHLHAMLFALTSTYASILAVKPVKHFTSSIALHGHVLQEQNMHSGSDYDARILSDEMHPKSRNDIFWSVVATHTIKWSVRMHIIILSALGEAQVDVPELIRQGRELGKANASCEVAGCVAWSPLCIE